MDEFIFESYRNSLSSEYQSVLIKLANQLNPKSKENHDASITWGGKVFWDFISKENKGPDERNLFRKNITTHTGRVERTLTEITSKGLGEESTKIVFCYSAYIHEKAYQVSFPEFLLDFYNYSKGRPSSLDFSADAKLFKQIEKKYKSSKSQYTRVIVAAAITFLITVSIVIGWNIYQVSNTEKSIQSIVSNSYAPIAFHDGVMLMRGYEVPEKTIESTLFVIDAYPKLTPAELIDLFKHQAKSYINAQNAKTNEDTSNETKRMLKSVKEYMGRGEFSKAEQVIKISLEGSAFDFSLGHEAMGNVKSMEGDYIHASESYLKAAKILAEVKLSEPKAQELLNKSIKALAIRAVLINDHEAAEEIIEINSWRLAKFGVVASEETIAEVKIQMAKANLRLANIFSDVKYFLLAEEIYSAIDLQCDKSEVEPSSICYELERGLVEMLITSGAKVRHLYDNYQQKYSRFSRAVKSASSALYHAKATGGEVLLFSEVNFEYASYMLGKFEGSAEEMKLHVENLVGIYKEQYSTLITQKQMAPLELIYKVLLQEGRHGRIKDVEILKELFNWKKSIVESNQHAALSRDPTQYVDVAEMSRLMWAITGKLEYLVTGISMYEKVFPRLIEISPVGLGVHQINMGITVSEYGQETSNLGTLERAMFIFYAAMENFMKGFYWEDARLAIHNLVEVIDRAIIVDERQCLHATREAFYSTHKAFESVISNLKDVISTLEKDKEKQIAAINLLAKAQKEFTLCMPLPGNNPSNFVYPRTASL